jgi:hypothetical protein
VRFFSRVQSFFAGSKAKCSPTLQLITEGFFLGTALQVSRGLYLDLGSFIEHVESVPFGAHAVGRPQRRAHEELGEDAPQVVGQDVRVSPGPKVSNGLPTHRAGDNGI